MFRRQAWAIAAALALAATTSHAQEAARQSAEAAADPYKVPQTDDVQVLAAFIENITKDRPTSAAGAMALESKMSGVMEAAQRILMLEKDTTSKAYRLAKRLVLKRIEIRKVAQQGTRPEQKAFLDELFTFVSAGEKSEDDMWLGYKYALGLEYGDGKELAPQAYERFGRFFATSSDAKAALFGKCMLGVDRRSKLVGQPLELRGTTLSGEAFDLKSLRGKVVLVDFWATWCGPCLAEHVEIAKHYKKYRDKGFEVVGWSIDEDSEKLSAFINREKVPWIIVRDAANPQWPEPVVDYGIFGIPRLFLVDREGKVVSTTARGTELTRLLGELFEKDK